MSLIEQYLSAERSIPVLQSQIKSLTEQLTKLFSEYHDLHHQICEQFFILHPNIVSFVKVEDKFVKCKYVGFHNMGFYKSPQVKTDGGKMRFARLDELYLSDKKTSIRTYFDNWIKTDPLI